MKTRIVLMISVLGLLLFVSSASTRAARPPAPVAQGVDGVAGVSATLPAAQQAHLAMSSVPPALSDAQIAQFEAAVARSHKPAETPLPVGDTAQLRPDSVPDPASATVSHPLVAVESPQAPSAPGTFRYFRNSDLGATIKSHTSGLTGEPAIANDGPIVFATGNWWAAISADGGKTFSYISPYTMFPASAYGGFCCDQWTVYDPSRDFYFWYLQYNSGIATGAVTGHNIFRIAAAHPADALAGNWWYWDFTSADNTEWDYPDVCMSNDFVYVTTNRGTFNSNSVNRAWVFRFPLDPLPEGIAFGYTFWDLATFPVGNLSLKCTRGARDTVYFGSHNSTSQIRVFRVAENSGTMFWDDVNLSASWFGPNSCPTPDGRDWCSFDDGRIKGAWVGRGSIGFLWNSGSTGAGSGFGSIPYTEAARVKESDRSYVNRPLIWSATQAWQYAAAAPNVRGDVGIVVHWSSLSTPPSFTLGLDDDYSRDSGYGPGPWEVYDVRYGTQGPNVDRWGDYFSVQSFTPNGLGWTASGTTMQGCGIAGCKETRYEVFGRERDLRGVTNYYGLNFALNMPLIRR